MSYQPLEEIILADASASTGGRGKITTVPASGTLLVMLANSGPHVAQQVDWRVRSNQVFSVQLYRSRTIPTATITLTDATAVDAGDTFVLNGNTYTYQSGSNVPASRVIGLGASNTQAATNTATLLSDQTYGVIGATAASVRGSGNDVITITPTSAYVLQFGQGTSDASEVAWADTRVTSLTRDLSNVWSGCAANSTTSSGDLFPQWIDGWPYAWALITNGSGSAQTLTVAATRYA